LVAYSDSDYGGASQDRKSTTGESQFLGKRLNLKLRDEDGIVSIPDTELFENLTLMGTVTESSLRRNLKLQDEEGISSLPDTELFENLTLMGYNISPNQKFTFQKGFNEFSSNIATALVFLATNRTYNFSKMIFDGLVKNINNKVSKFLMYPLFLTMCLRMAQFVQITHTQKYVGEGSGTPTEPHHTPSQEAQPSSPTHISTSSIPTVISIPTVTQSEPIPLRQYTRRARIAQSFALSPVADEPTSPVRDVNQDRANIAKSSTLPYDTAPRVTSPAAVEGNLSPIKGRRLDEEEGITGRVSSDTEEIKMDEGEVAVERTSEDTEEMATVLTSMDAVTVLAGGIDVPTGSCSIPTAGPPAVDIHTGSDAVPTASLIVATATIVTPYSRRKGKEVMVKDFKGMTFEECEAKFVAVWKLVEDFIPMGSKEEAERLKRKGFNLEQEKAKKQKTSEEVPDKEKSLEEIPKEKVMEMMQLIPIEEVYVQALQVKHPIINWKVHIEGQRSYLQIIRLGGSSACYQFFVDLLKHLDREDLN
nr:hypothetical protein [Tanacetum cinerariifolium]